MVKKEKQKVEVSAGMKVCRVIGVVMVVAAIGYMVWQGDFDQKGIVGYMDDPGHGGLYICQGEFPAP